MGKEPLGVGRKQERMKKRKREEKDNTIISYGIVPFSPQKE
jgi:hypothetical protein